MNFNKNENTYRINEDILEKEVRVVGNNIKSSIIPISEAISLARSMELDLVEINGNVKPSICKIMDYQKFLYEEKKKKRKIEKDNKIKRGNVKEIRFGANTGNHDFEFKKRHIIEFLRKGDRVKAYVIFKGGEIKFKERGEIILLKLAEEIKEYGVPNSLPKLEGKKLIITIDPKKNIK